MTSRTEAFRAARDLLLREREDAEAAVRAFRWPELEEFNWALDWFDRIGGDRPALRVVEPDGAERTASFAQLAERSNRVANHLRSLGVARGDRVIVMLGNRVELWETLLAAMKLGAVVIPATTLLGPDDLRDRIERGGAAHLVAGVEDAAKADAAGAGLTRVAVGGRVRGWHAYEEAEGAPAAFRPDGPTRASDPLLLYFTSGTTARPKLVEHTHVSYPVGHLSTMYWIGVRPGDRHLNVSSPGWAKHAWSSFYAPWSAEATVVAVNQPRFEARRLLDEVVRCGVTTLCAPPTVWRMLIQEDLSAWEVAVREAVAAGEPLNPEVIERVRAAWGITVRDGYGQTETTAQIGNPPGAAVRVGALGRPLPGYRVALLDPVTGAEADEGELALPLDPPPLGLMSGYRGGGGRGTGGWYRTGDVARRNEDGTITYVGRADDVFKASDYRISPFELESVLLEHPACAEAAVVPAPDPLRLAVPKAYVALAPGHEPTRETALDLLRFARGRLAPYKRVRRVEFAELPKTISGKIRRVELRTQEGEREGRGPAEFREEDFPELRSGAGSAGDVELPFGLETDVERAVAADPEWRAGLAWGEPRRGHPEGTVALHVADVLANVEREARTPEERRRLRLAALVHDAFKFRAPEGRARVGTPGHHGSLAAGFLAGLVDDPELVLVVRWHDEAFAAWKAGARRRDWERAEQRGRALVERLGPALPLYLAFFRCDNGVAGKSPEPVRWFERVAQRCTARR